MINPDYDPNFAAHPAHGIEAQRGLIRVALSFCKRRRTAIDVGAHIGTWSCELAKTFRDVVAFEPNPDTMRCLRENIPTNVAAFCAALGDSSELQAMEFPLGGNSGMWHIRAKSEQGLVVRVSPLDKFYYTSVDLIKIDTEGYEGRVLLGATQTLERERPVVVFEDNGLGPKYFGDNWIDPKTILALHGYERAVRIRKDEIWTPR